MRSTRVHAVEGCDTGEYTDPVEEANSYRRFLAQKTPSQLTAMDPPMRSHLAENLIVLYDRLVDENVVNEQRLEDLEAELKAYRIPTRRMALNIITHPVQTIQRYFSSRREDMDHLSTTIELYRTQHEKTVAAKETTYSWIRTLESIARNEK